MFCIAVVNQVPKVWFGICLRQWVLLEVQILCIFWLHRIRMLDNCLPSWISGCLYFCIYFSPGFLRLVNVLVGMSGDERKAFLQFTTGCSSLPPGGLANLQPRLTIVRKVDNSDDGSYPSVNTCAHYLKLPEYSSEEILHARLLAATKEKGFYLN